MKQLNKWNRIKVFLASVLVTVAVVAPVLMVSADTPHYAELLFESASLKVMPDGSVQAIFDVAVDKVQNCSGVEFYLHYNGTYLTPSYIAADDTHTVNQVATENGFDYTDVFFRPDANLYGMKDGDGNLINPFRKLEKNATYYCSVDADNRELHMKLWLDQALLREKGLNTTSTTHIGRLDETNVEDFYVGEEGSDPLYLVNMSTDAIEDPANEVGKGGKVVLGQISFQVNKDKVTEMLQLFNTGGWVEGTTRNELNSLIYAERTTRDQTWSVGVYDRGTYGTDDISERHYKPAATAYYRNCMDLYKVNFDGKEPISVVLTNPVISINAYQGYSFGDVGDIVYILGKYSPMATITYADGSMENVVVPWGVSPVHGHNTAYTPLADEFEILSNGTIALTGNKSTAYAATGGHYYPSQKVVIPMDNGAGGTTYSLFPVPVQADLTVTPVTLLNVTAPDTDRNYLVNTVTQEIHTGSDLALPTEARLITDIVPGNVSLVMDIPGWTPVQPDAWTTGSDPLSTWPKVDEKYDSTHMMNSLKAKDYVIPAEAENYLKGTPYWPDQADAASATEDLKNHPEKFVGTYVFTTAKTFGGEEMGFEKADIQAAYPWLTVPKDKYPLGADGSYSPLESRRHIVSLDQLTPGTSVGTVPKYVAKYVSTVDDSGNDQPTVTIRVTREVNSTTTTISENSKFRIWLPNGVELGTGMKSKNILNTPKEFTVDNWFEEPVSLVKDGWYTATAEGSPSQSFLLAINPGDPTRNVYGAEREALRRYINLGGWFTVSVCEDEDQYVWCAPIPVYVPPRTNYYTETKTYNFLGMNAKLMQFGTNVPNRVAMPRGEYSTVDSIGQPEYVGPGNTAVTTPTSQRWKESYGITTTYDGQTGAQPGVLYKFEVADVSYVGVTPPNAPADQTDGMWDILPAGDQDGLGTNSMTDATVAGTTSTAVIQRGATEYKDNALYEAYGYVHQRSAVIQKYATLRTQNVVDRTGVEKITLTSAEPSGMTWDADNKNVRLATYNTVTEGYQSRQTYTFTITNVGDVDIYGLGIDGLVDGYTSDPPGGRFEMLQPPADFLAPGESTTFVLTYVYDLAANDGNPEAYYDRLYITSDRHPAGGIDKTEGTDYLRYFDAKFDVSKSAIHSVTLIVLPETVDDSKTGDDKLDVTYPMGTADVVLGEQVSKVLIPDSSPAAYKDVYTMDFTSATRNYPSGRTVYIAVEPKDEYTLVPLICIDSANNSITINPYDWTKTDYLTGTVTLSNGVKVGMVGGEKTYVLEQPEGETDYKVVETVVHGKMVFAFEMPDYDVTVTVRFIEELDSKLRLKGTDTIPALIDYSAGPNYDKDDPTYRFDQTKDFNMAGTADELLKPAKDPVAAANTYKVWRKQYTKSELEDAAHWVNVDFKDKGLSPDLYLMTVGAAVPYDAKPSGDTFDPSHNQYLVVIPYDADRSQIEAALRQVEVAVSGYDSDDNGSNDDNLDIRPDVVMRLYGTHFSTKTAVSSANIADDESRDFTGNPSENGRLICRDLAGATATPTVHHSQVFDSPLPGESKYVRIAVGVQVGTTTHYRYYYVEIHRAMEDAEARLNYGNSPYGMIMNDAHVFPNEASQNSAKETFRESVKQTSNNVSVIKKAYTFQGQTTVPTVVTGKVDNVIYWREAWVKNRQLYEPESGLGRDWVELKEDETDPDKVTGYKWVDKPEVYDEADNLDLNDYAYFAILGENFQEPGLAWAKDSSGRTVDLSKVAVSVEITQLNPDAATQVGRFSGTSTKTLDLGYLDDGKNGGTTVDDTLVGLGKELTWIGTTAPADTTNAFWPVEHTGSKKVGEDTVETYAKVENIRPGRYALTYTYLDFDGAHNLTVTRPLVILSPVGDVNADLTRNAGYTLKTPPATGYEGTDEYLLENRVVDPLGYDAGTAPETGFPAGKVYPYANIFKLRVCDVNNDRNINNIDGNLIYKNVQAGSGFIRFYLPTGYGLRRNLPTT